MPWGFRVLLALNVVYCTLGLISGRFPAWRMFERVEAMNAEFRDARGERVDLKDFLPRDAHPTAFGDLIPVAVFACTRLSERGPFILTESIGGFRATLDPREGCHAFR